MASVVLAGVAFYWAVSAYINCGVFITRCMGSSSISAVPGVATIFGLPSAAIVREWFGWVESPAVYLIAIAPDVLIVLGEVVLYVRVRLLGWPDRARQPGRSDAPADR